MRWLTPTARAIVEPITGREDLGDLSRPAQAMGQFYRAFDRGPLALDLAIRTTRIFRGVHGRWRQIHHHGSIVDSALLGAYRDAVAGRTR